MCASFSQSFFAASSIKTPTPLFSYSPTLLILFNVILLFRTFLHLFPSQILSFMIFRQSSAFLSLFLRFSSWISSLIFRSLFSNLSISTVILPSQLSPALFSSTTTTSVLLFLSFYPPTSYSFLSLVHFFLHYPAFLSPDGFDFP